MEHRLKQFFFDAYGFRNTKLQKPSRNAPFKIDDFGEADSRYDLFCHISLTVTDDDSFDLDLDNTPINDDVRSLVNSVDGKEVRTDATTNIVTSLRTSDTLFIRKLASAIGGVISRGQKYKVRHWRWTALRTQRSLERFADNLDEFNARWPDDSDDELNLFKFNSRAT